MVGYPSTIPLVRRSQTPLLATTPQAFKYESSNHLQIHQILVMSHAVKLVDYDEFGVIL